MAVIATPLVLALAVVLLGSLAAGSASSASYGSSESSGSSGSGLFGTDTFGPDRGATADEPAHAPSTTAPAWPYDGTGGARDVGGTPEATATGSGGDGGYAYPTSSVPGTAAASATGEPGDVVTAFFEAINDRDYRTAWALGGRNLESRYDRFVAGYAATARDTISITSVRGTRVRLTIEALQVDGTTHSYDAVYTVRGGVITSGTATRTD
ncbi:hypothetical protein EBF04_11920 [Streptomyces sp. I6]|nr:hypothetical protein EBF04_11920 [Streptomyces sp. I6]